MSLPTGTTTFPIVCATEDELETFRYHLLRFHGHQNVDLAQFEQPARLHRKDPRNLQFQLSLKEMDKQKADSAVASLKHVEERNEYRRNNGLDDEVTDDQVDERMLLDKMGVEEKAKYLAEKKLKDAEEQLRLKNEEELKKVAPDGSSTKPTNNHNFKKKGKKVRQVKVYNEAKRKLRYEEFYPWVLEDYDAKEAWVGNYEAGSIENQCILIFDDVHRIFKAFPVEKMYKFTPRNKYATLTLEEAEAKMAEKGKIGRWLMNKMENEVEDGKRKDTRFRKRVDDDGDEEMDYDEEFQDDEEAPIMEGEDEEKKLIDRKIKSEMLSASNLIEKSDDEFDDLFDDEPDKESKKLRKALSKNAVNEVYASDDEDENPYLSESELEEEEEPDQDEQAKKESIVKEEEDDELLLNSTSNSPKKNNKKSEIYITKNNSGFITIKAPTLILKKFPKGEWNPITSIKRKIDIQNEEEPVSKKIKLEPVSSSIGREFSPVSPQAPSPSASPPVSNGKPAARLEIHHLNNILANGPVPLVQVVHQLGPILRSPENKALLKQYMKQNFSVRNKMLYHRE